MQLHIISRSPYNHQAFSQALATIANDDYVLLIDDAVYALTGSTLHTVKQQQGHWLALQDDLSKRGLPLQYDGIESINMDRFVQLSLSVKNCVSWY